MPSCYFTQVLQLLLPAVLAQTQVDIDFTCLEGGTTASCESFITTFCETVHNITFATDDTASRCFNIAADGVRCDFTTQNFVSTTSPPNEASCADTLSVIMEECTTGGFGNAVGGVFTFAVEPNTGACPKIV